MAQRTIQILFTLLRSAISGERLTDKERSDYRQEMLPELLKISSKHDLSHLLAWALKQNDLLPEESAPAEKCILKAVYRYEKLRYEYDCICDALEKAEIPFLPLKGSVIRKYYPEPWMRTSCDIDILVHREDLDRAISYLSTNLSYVFNEGGTHDVSLYSPSGIHVELHFDLVEEGQAKAAIDVLHSVWDNASLCENSVYRYEMSDAYFYFYHIAHMAKHFEVGGCGVRPFIDLWILNGVKDFDAKGSEALLTQAGLLKFAIAAQTLSEVWFDGRTPNDVSDQMQNYLLHGGVYGSADNRVALHQAEKGGRFGYFMSRVFIPYDKLRRYYPVLEKHRWLMPVMQVRRWFMLFRPDVAKRTKSELATNKSIDQSKADEMNALLKDLGL